MSIKEDWTSSDKFNYNNWNEIVNTINIINDKLKIRTSETVKRNIVVGDNLTSRTIYCEFPDDLYDEIINDVGSGQANIITTNDHNLIEYSNMSNNVASVAKDIWYEGMIYHADTSTGEVFVNSKEDKLIGEWGEVTAINTNLSVYNYIYIYEEFSRKNRGDYIFSEELQKLEDNLEKIAIIVNTSFKKRNWYYLSVIDYNDINRWSVLLNYAYEKIFAQSENIITEAEEPILTEDDQNIMTEELEV